jgi:hypothetical protein
MSRALLFSVLAFLSLGGLAQESGQDTQPTPQTEQMQQMQTRMQAMREQMARIHATDDPEERQRLMQEHMRTMHEEMTMMGQRMGMMQQMMEQMMGQMMQGGASDTLEATPEDESHEEHH